MVIKDWFERVKQFVAEVRAEWKKVTKPTRDEVVGTTAVVLVASLIFALYLAAADIAIDQGLKVVFKALGS